jgi:NTE family protein
VKIGLILGGGGEVGVVWELGVLAALKADTGFTAADCAVVVGTSAGSYVGALTAHGADPGQLMQAIITGPSLSPTEVEVDADGDAGRGTSAIPDDIAAAMMTPGSAQERAVAIGKLALATPTALTADQFRAATAAMLGVQDWPAVDFRATSVAAETGETVLWSRASGVDLVTAVASSYAIPGFFPLVEINGAHYFDVPRAHYLADLAAEESLDAVVYIAMDLPVLVNSDELSALTDLAARGVRVINITNGPAFHEIGADLMNPAVRGRAGELGQEDGHRYATELRDLLNG